MVPTTHYLQRHERVEDVRVMRKSKQHSAHERANRVHHGGWEGSRALEQKRKQSTQAIVSPYAFSKGTRTELPLVDATSW